LQIENCKLQIENSMPRIEPRKEQPMPRRYLLTVIGLLFAASAVLPATAAETDRRPNILFVMSDDHCVQAISAYGGMLAEVAPTPNIDRLAKGGMVFRNCFVTNSICTPSRAAIFTGKYAHVNGVYKFTALDQSQPTLPKLMQKAGYHTALIGKYHLHSNPVGLDYWSILPGQGRYINPQFVEMGDQHASGRVARGKRTAYKGHSSDVIGDKALEYLKDRRPKDKPFMFFCHFKASHDPFTHAPKYNELFADVAIPEPDNLFDDFATRSDALKQQLQYIGHHDNGMDFKRETGHILDKKERIKAQYQIYLKKYLRCVRGIDDNMGRILDYLDASGLAENTIVVYTADQGFFLGEHGMYDKRFMYEEALRMPLLVRRPGKIKAGSVSEDMVLNVNFAPTLLEAAGAKPLVDMQGRSFLSILHGKTPADWRTSMYYRYYFSHFRTPAHFGVRTRTHKLIFFQGIDQWELFDLVKDPNEMNNVYGKPQYAAVEKQLKDELARLQKELKDDVTDMGNNPRPGF